MSTASRAEKLASTSDGGAGSVGVFSSSKKCEYKRALAVNGLSYGISRLDFVVKNGEQDVET